MVNQYAPPTDPFSDFDIAQIVGPDGLDPEPELPQLWQPSMPQPTEQPRTNDVSVIPATGMDMLELGLYGALRQEVPAVPTNKSFFGRFAGTVVDIVGKPIDKTLDALSYPADITERALNVGIGLAFYNDLDLGQRWELGNLLYETFGKGPLYEEAERLATAGDDKGLDEFMKRNEGGWVDLALKFALDPLNIFGVAGLGLVAKGAGKVGAGENIVSGLTALNRGIDLTDTGIALRQVNNPLWMRFLGEVTPGVRHHKVVENRLMEAADRARRETYTTDALRRMGKEWLFRPQNWLRRLVEQTPQSKRDAMAYAFSVNARITADMAQSFPEMNVITRHILNGDVEAIQRLPVGAAWKLSESAREPAPGLLAIQAIGDDIASGIRKVDINQMPSMKKGWWDGPAEAWDANPELQKTLYRNKETWTQVWMNDLLEIAGRTDKPGALDHYAGLGGKLVTEQRAISSPPSKGPPPGFVRLYRSQHGPRPESEIQESLTRFNEAVRNMGPERAARMYSGPDFPIRDAADYERFLRGETRTAEQGRWFSSRLDIPEILLEEDRIAGHPRVRDFFYVDVPEAVARQAEYRNFPGVAAWNITNRADEEYLLPIEYNAAMKPLSSVEAERAGDFAPANIRPEDAPPGAFETVVRFEEDTPTALQQVGREMERLHGHVKGAMSYFWLNTPRYVVANMIGNTTRMVGAIGSDAFRSSRTLTETWTPGIIQTAAMDVARQTEVGLSTKGVRKGLFGLPESWVKPFVVLGNRGPGFGDIPVRNKIVAVSAERTYVANIEKFLPAFDDTGMSPEVWPFLKAQLMAIRTPGQLQAFAADVRKGAIGLDPMTFSLNRILDEDAVPMEARHFIYDLIDPNIQERVRAARNGNASPDGFRNAIDRIIGEQEDLWFQLLPEDPQPIVRRLNASLHERRVYWQREIHRTETERWAAVARMADMNGIDAEDLKPAFETYYVQQDQSLRNLYHRLDFELDHEEATGAVKKARAAALREHDKLMDAEWQRLDAAVKERFAGHVTARQWWDYVGSDRKAMEKAHRDLRKALFKQLDDEGIDMFSPQAKPLWEKFDADRSKLWLAHIDNLLTPVGLQRLPRPDEIALLPTTDAAALARAGEAFDPLVGRVHVGSLWTQYLERMKGFADDFYAPAGEGVFAARSIHLPPEQVERVARYLEDFQETQAALFAASLRAGHAMAGHAVLDYDRRYGFDTYAKYLFPYHFWPSRMAHRFAKASLARPGAAASFALLVQHQEQETDMLPERLQGKFRIPVPFLPDWMGENLYFDPIRMLFPFAAGIDPSIDDENGMVSKVNSWFSSIGAGPAPWISLPLQMSGGLGERQKWIRYQMSGLPFGLPGTAAQQAISSFLSGDPPQDWENELTPDDVDNLTLGNAFPEPRLREILGMPPGDVWDMYRVHRMLASMAGDGTLTPEEALKAMKLRTGPHWDLAKERAADESGIRNLSAWALGMGGTIYPKGEEIQNGLKMLYDTALEADRKNPQGSPDSNIKAFFEAFPEFQVRQVQKKWYNGQAELDAELDTSLFYIDLAKITDEYEPQIAYYEKLKASLPKGMRKQVSEMLAGLYASREERVDTLNRVYSKRKETPSVYASPTERALQYLRNEWFRIDGKDYPELAGKRELFLRRLGGRGVADREYALAAEADQVLVEYDQRLASANNSERDGLYKQRLQRIEDLTVQAMAAVSREDFERFLAASKREPSEQETALQRAEDGARKLFGASEESRRIILGEHPELVEWYGPNPDPLAAGAINSWWRGYFALQPNSMARDDYVQANSPALNALREAVGLPPLMPRERPVGGPLTIWEDPYMSAYSELAGVS